jgi:D-glycero-alpha-D-manno-heptose 1-phosphate guanylyltransferase
MGQRSKGSDKEMKEAVILCGGQGLRLKGHTNVPKPFLIIDIETGETLLEAQLKWLLAYDFEHVILAISRENYKYMRINYSRLMTLPWLDPSVEDEYLGTGGALRKALDLVEEKNFYVMNVDDICSYDPNELYDAQRNSNAILIKQARLPFGVVEVGPDMKVIDFVEKPTISKYVSCGHYVFNRKLVEQFLPTEGDLEQTLLRELAKQGLLYAHVLTGKWITINTFKDLLEARRGLKE